jgi:ATP-binding cassette subfamily B protein
MSARMQRTLSPPYTGPPPPKGVGRRVFRLFQPYRFQISLAALAIVVTSALGVVNPFLVRAVFDRALFRPGGPNMRLLVELIALMIVIPLISALIGVGQTYVTNVVGNRVMRDLRDRLFTHLQSMELAFFTSTKTGEIQSRLANDVGGVQSVVTNTASSIAGNVVTVISVLVASFLLSWQLTLVTLCVVPIFVFANVRVGRTRRRVAARTQQTMADMSATTQESLSVSGILLAKVFNRQGFEAERYRAENERLADLQVRQQMTGQSFFALVQSFFAITPALVYLVAGWQLSNGNNSISAGTLVAFTTLQTRVLFPIMSLLRVSNDVQTSMALFGRVFEYLDLRPAIVDRPDAVPLPRDEARGDVTFRDVDFRYPGAEGDTLHAIDLEVRSGQLAAIVGPSGSGKSTLCSLIPRLYDATGGAVEIDGHDVRDVTLSSLAEICGTVTQDSYLFHASIRDNLRYARPDATDDELEHAARLAAIHDRIVAFDDGYETIVGERGYRLSGGEKQRLAIARVILKDPRVLILDEATSALDTTSERLVQAALEPLMEGRTTIAIAHRLSTILAADVIFVVDDGRIVERGSHAELLAQGGLYAQLYEQQFAGGEVESRCQNGIVLRSGRVLPTPAVAGTGD